jgi:hypothetical protein
MRHFRATNDFRVRDDERYAVAATASLAFCAA